MRRREIIAGARKAFFAAMLFGYAGNGTVRKVGPTSITRYLDDDWEVVNRWTTNSETGFTVGTTMIYYKNQPVWFMYYSGHYPDEVIPLLKRVLVANYRRNRFYGGRGPTYLYFSKEGYIYRNCPDGNKDHFEVFTGLETIAKRDTGTMVGYHRYQGNLMI